MESISVAAGSKTFEEFRDWVKVTLRRGLSASHPPPIAQPSTEAPVVTQRQESTVPPHSPQTPTIYDPLASASSSTKNTRGKGKAKALSEESSSTPKHARNDDHGAPKTNNSAYVDEQRKLKLEAKAEKERIRKLLETDKAMRAMREMEVRVARERERGNRVGQVENETVESAPTQDLMKAGGNGVTCALSFRLLDGSSLKHKFSAEAKLGIDVRKWIDQVLHLTLRFTTLVMSDLLIELSGRIAQKIANTLTHSLNYSPPSRTSISLSQKRVALFKALA